MGTKSSNSRVVRAGRFWYVRAPGTVNFFTYLTRAEARRAAKRLWDAA